MASAGTKTTNLSLTQYQAGDTLDFFAEYNADMRKIDAGVGDKSKVIVLADGASLPTPLDAKAMYYKKVSDGSYEVYDGTGALVLIHVLAEHVMVNVSGTLTALSTVLDGKASTSTATSSAAGLMSAADKTKFDDIAGKQTEIGYLAGLTSNAQAQINALSNGKLNKTGDTLSLGTPLGVASGGTGADGSTVAGILLARGNLGIDKQIWSGAAESGDVISVPGLNNYRCYFCTFTNSSFAIICSRAGSLFAGSNFYVASATASTQYYLYATISSEQVSIVRIGYMNHTPGGSHGALAVWTTLSAIYGIA